MKRPEKVSVLGSRYKIQYVDGAPLDPDDLGECDSVKHVISIREGKPLQTEQRTVIHESIEAMNLTALIGLRHTQIEQLETCLFQWLQENPSLISYLRRKK